MRRKQRALDASTCDQARAMFLADDNEPQRTTLGVAQRMAASDSMRLRLEGQPHQTAGHRRCHEAA
jgi:hypothetical protein